VDVKVGRCYELIVTTFAGKLLGYFLSLFFQTWLGLSYI
jgi:hypothetical protein